MVVNIEKKENVIPAAKTKDDVLLSLKDLHVWFELRRFGFGHAGYVKAVDGVTFDLHYSDSIAIVGESGCGKSTLMRTILGLNKPIKGNITFEGKDISS